MSTMTAPRKIEKGMWLSSRHADAKIVDGKADVEGLGYVEGYAAVFNTADQVGETFRPGSFQKSINERVAAGKVKLMIRHFRDGGDVKEMVGTVTEMREDDYGLWYHADYGDWSEAQDTRKKVAGKHITANSIGFMAYRWEDLDGKDGLYREYLEAGVLEVTLTVFPMHEGAIITDAKSQAAPTDGKAGDAGESDSGTPGAPKAKGRVRETALELRLRMLQLQGSDE